MVLSIQQDNAMTELLDVRSFGAVGDGVTDDTAAIQATLDAAYGASGHGIDYHFSRVVIIPAGIYRTTAPLTICNTWGARVVGAGMSSTIIRNETDDSIVISTNGVGYSTFEHMRLEAPPGGVGFDYNWDGGGAVGSQMVTFYKIMFSGIGGRGAPAFGCKVGYGGWQCDTSSWIDCCFGGDVGLSISNLNAISHRVVGGNFQGCRVGIHVPAGAIQEITGVGFQESAEWDIRISGGAGDATHISGVSTESANFVWCQTQDCAVTIIGCGQRSGTPGVFANGATVLNIEGCMSKAGTVGSGHITTIRNSQFWRIDALDAFVHRGSSLIKLENTVFGLDVGSTARREIDTIITSAGKRTRGVEGISLTAESVVSAGVANGNDDGGNTHFFPIEISIGSPAVVGSATRWINSGSNRHGFIAGTVIAFMTTGALPTGVTADTAYYVLADGLTDTTFRIADSPGGTAIKTSGSQSGVHSLYLVRVYAVGDQILNSAVAAGGSPGWVCTTAGPAIGVAVFKPMANVAA
jgi:Pectate lyase superfamily protein